MYFPCHTRGNWTLQKSVQIIMSLVTTTRNLLGKQVSVEQMGLKRVVIHLISLIREAGLIACHLIERETPWASENCIRTVTVTTSSSSSFRRNQVNKHDRTILWLVGEYFYSHSSDIHCVLVLCLPFSFQIEGMKQIASFQ